MQTSLFRYSNQLIFLVLGIAAITACGPAEEQPQLKLWYEQPASSWTEALPVGNGRLAAMVFGGVEKEQIQFNEETLWTGSPHDYAHPGAYRHLEAIRQLLFDGKQEEAEHLAMEEFMSLPLRQMAYQPFGDLYLEFPGHGVHSDYHRELDIENAICKTSYKVNGIQYTREVIASYPANVIGVHIKADKKKMLDLNIRMDTGHELKVIETKALSQDLQVTVKDGGVKGLARFVIETDGTTSSQADRVIVTGASVATIWLSASTNVASYREVNKDAGAELDAVFKKIKDRSFEALKQSHMEDYRGLYDRFAIEFGNNLRDTLPTDQRIELFSKHPEDPQLLALYAQYGRYLLISSSRPGTQPANLQGKWNKDLNPAWGSKYTININTEMNYWPAEVTNLAECHEPLFQMLREISETGRNVAREHYNLDGWVIHHNTDLWRGAAPINHANHGIWVGGSGWLSHHLWEHYLFSGDERFLRDDAYPIMKGAALFYSEYLVEDPGSGLLISTPSNSPENGGLVAGPTMDHQIIRSLFNACAEAASILDTDEAFAASLKELAGRIAPNKIGKYGQLQEWMADVDDPENKHRHVSHLWGMHPAKDINWETSPEMMEAAKQSLLFRGDEGTGWSLAWKINFWSRLREGDHAYKLIKMIFRPVFSDQTNYRGRGGSYANLFDAHPPFQIDGNFGAAAGMVEMLIQSHLSGIDILPALPSMLPEGSLSGVCARGGFELSFSWTGGQLSQLKLHSTAGKPCSLRYKNHVVSLQTEPGKVYTYDGQLNRTD